MKKIILVLSIMLLVACGKKGDTGPMGPQGLPGEPGAPGGSMNIQDHYFSVDEAELTLTPEGYLAFVDKTIDGISAESIVIVYEKTTNNTWRPLPYTDAVDTYDAANVDVVITRTFSVYDGGIRIEHFTSLTFGYKFWRSGNYRVVVFE